MRAGSVAFVSELRHRLLTPLNHILGYAEMLLEDSPETGYRSAQQHLQRIRETARELARFIHANFVRQAGKAATQSAFASLRYDLAAPLHTILQAVGAITSEPLPRRVIADVMKIGRAATELLGIAHAPGENGKAAATPVPRGRRTAPAVKHQPGRILIVDDNRANRDLLARRLKRQGHHVSEAASGAEALERLIETPQDVVILDVLMPKLDGFQVLERIKADPALTGIPVIVVSAMGELPAVARALEIGAEDYLFKPLDPMLMAARIASCLEKKRLHDSERQRTAELEQARERLRVARERLRLALKVDRARVWEWDFASGRVHGVRARSFEQALERVHAEDRERVRERLMRAIEQRTDFHDQMRLAKRGAAVWIESLGTLQLDSEGRPERMTGITRDISERRRMEEEVRRAIRENQLFSAAAAHDLEEPLREAASALHEIASRMHGRMPDEDTHTVNSAARSLERMLRLTAELVEYSRIGATPVHKRPVPAESALRQAVANLKAAIESSRARITHDKLPVVAADFSVLHRVFQNLINNAIELRGKEKPAVHIAARQERGRWVFSVSDNGPGIDAERRASLFGVFRPNGLGLAISKKMIEMLGGAMWAESTPGNGSTFYFALPAE